MTSTPERTSIFAMLMSIVGTGLAVLFLGLSARTIMSFSSYAFATLKADASPEMVSMVLGKALIAIVLFGLFAVPPTLLLGIAMGVLKMRQRWFYFSTCAFATLSVFVIPIGTLCGVMLLIMASRRRAEFFPATARLTPPLTLTPT